MKSSHTPGPRVVSLSGRSVNAGGIRIAQHGGPSAASCSVDESLRLEREANARLIAAAPELLAMGFAALDYLKSRADDESNQLWCVVRDADVESLESKSEDENRFAT